jgi:hypothetical protein
MSLQPLAGAAEVGGVGSMSATEWYVIGIVLLPVYFLPTIVAQWRRVPARWTITVGNVFLGLTLVGWVVLLGVAVWPTRRASKQSPPSPSEPPPANRSEGSIIADEKKPAR